MCSRRLGCPVPGCRHAAPVSLPRARSPAGVHGSRLGAWAVRAGADAEVACGYGQVIARSRQVWSKEADKADLRSRTAFVAGDFFRSGALAAPACLPPGTPETPGCCIDHVVQTRTMPVRRHGVSERMRAPWPCTGSR